jgi:hypothetical protein
MVIFGCATSQQTSRIYSFNGQSINDEDEGFVVEGTDIGRIILITNTKYSYGIVLPYSEKWKIEINKDYPLFAVDHESNNTISVMIKHYDNQISDKEYLTELLSNLKTSNMYVLKSISFLTKYNQNILRYRSMPKRIPDTFKEDVNWAWNYLRAIRKDNKFYIIHWSKRDKRPGLNGASNELRILGMMTEGFTTNFKHKENRRLDWL